METELLEIVPRLEDTRHQFKEDATNANSLGSRDRCLRQLRRNFSEVFSDWPLENFGWRSRILFMFKALIRSNRAKVCTLTWVGIFAIGWAFDAIAASGPGFRPVAIPSYGDKTPWGIYFRQLQDTVATNWYKELVYYGYRSSISRGVVTAQYTITPKGKLLSARLLSNTTNAPSGNAVLRAISKSSMPQFPKEIAASAPSGMVVEQTFRYKENDPTNYGWASSYPQLLVSRSPDIGGASNLDLRRYFDLSKFAYQSRVVRLAGLPRGSVGPRRVEART